LAAIIVAALVGVPAAAVAQSVTLAVAPFANKTGKADRDALAKGLADMLITDLSTSKDFKLVERERLQALVAEMKLAKQGLIDRKTAQKMGKLLGADAILMGTMTALDPQLRLDARIVTVEAGEVMAAAKATGKLEEFFTVEGKLAGALLKAVGVALSPIQRMKLGKSGTRKITAFRAYSRGLDATDRGDKATAGKSFAAALASDPGFAKAKERLAALEKRVAQLEKRTEAVERAGGLILKPKSAIDHWSNAKVHLSRGNDSGAETSMRAALKLHPECFDVLLAFAKLRLRAGGSAPDDKAWRKAARGLPKPIGRALSAIAAADHARYVRNSKIAADTVDKGKAVKGKAARGKQNKWAGLSAWLRLVALGPKLNPRATAVERTEEAALVFRLRATNLRSPNVVGSFTDPEAAQAAARYVNGRAKWLQSRAPTTAGFVFPLPRAALVARPVVVSTRAYGRGWKPPFMLRVTVGAPEASQCFISVGKAAEIPVPFAKVQHLSGEATVFETVARRPFQFGRTHVVVRYLDRRGNPARYEADVELTSMRRDTGRGDLGALGEQSTSKYPWLSTHFGSWNDEDAGGVLLIDPGAGIWTIADKRADRFDVSPLEGGVPTPFAVGVPIRVRKPGQGSAFWGIERPILYRVGKRTLISGRGRYGVNEARGTRRWISSAQSLASESGTTLFGLHEGAPWRPGFETAAAGSPKGGWYDSNHAFAAIAKPAVQAWHDYTAPWRELAVAAGKSRQPWVWVSGAVIDRDEVTVIAYMACVRTGKCQPPHGSSCADQNGKVYRAQYGGDQATGCLPVTPNRYPITGITKAQAAAFCAWRGGELPKSSRLAKAATAQRENVGSSKRFIDNTLDAVTCDWMRFGRRKKMCDPDRLVTTNYWDGYGWIAPTGMHPTSGPEHVLGNVREWVKDGENKAFGCSWKDILGPDCEAARAIKTVSDTDVGFRCVYGSKPRLSAVGQAKKEGPLRTGKPSLSWESVPGGTFVYGEKRRREFPQIELPAAPDDQRDAAFAVLVGVSRKDFDAVIDLFAKRGIATPVDAHHLQEIFSRGRASGLSGRKLVALLQRFIAGKVDKKQMRSKFEAYIDPNYAVRQWLRKSRARDDRKRPADDAEKRTAMVYRLTQVIRGYQRIPPLKDAPRYDKRRGFSCATQPLGTCIDRTAMSGTRIYVERHDPRKVKLKGFKIMDREVTQAQFREAMGFNPSDRGCPNCPVVRATWTEAAAFCKKVGGRLPTEAEWEYAALGGGDKGRYGDLDDIARWRGNTSKLPKTGGKDDNGYDLHDMVGSVWEWTADRYERSDYISGALRYIRVAAEGEKRKYRAPTIRDVLAGKKEPPAGRVCLQTHKNKPLIEANLQRIPWKLEKPKRSDIIACYPNAKRAVAAVVEAFANNPSGPAIDPNKHGPNKHTRRTTQRVLKGGSYGADERLIGARIRTPYNAQLRHSFVGFRCAR